ncbi:MAG: hypothetical protein ACI9LV_000004 [Candidatus Nanohaloarchaea archaeon]|jgi:hypothetical protein
MVKGLRKPDSILVVFILFLAVLTGVIQQFTEIQIIISYVELAGPLAFLAAVSVLYKISMEWDSKLAAHVKVICIGGAFFTFGWIHRLLTGYLDLGRFFGGYTDFVEAFFASLAVGGTVLVAYGFFILREEGKKTDYH